MSIIATNGPELRRGAVVTRGVAVVKAAGLRSASGGKTLVGYASVFDAQTNIGRFDEVVRPGAFARAIRERQDVRALLNHDSNFVLGRNTSGTLRLAEDSTGLRVSIDLPDSAMADGVAVSIQRGDITGMSFAFRPAAGGERVTRDRETGRELRELLDVDLFDVGPVTFPAYESTSIALSRSASIRAMRKRLMQIRIDAIGQPAGR